MTNALIPWAGEIDYVTESARLRVGSATFKLTGCLLGITLYWQFDNARRAAALLLKGLHRENGMAALGENGGSEGGRVCMHVQWGFLFLRKSRQTSKLMFRGEWGGCVTSPEGDEMMKDWKQKKEKSCKEEDVAVKYKGKRRPSEKIIYSTWLQRGPFCPQRSLSSL